MTTTTTPSSAEKIAAVLRGLMNGEALPDAESPEFDRITGLIRGFLNTGTATDHQALGVLAVGLLIDAGRAHVQTARVLRDFGARS